MKNATADQARIYRVAVTVAKERVGQAQADLFDVIVQAKLAGTSWTTIAAGLGVTRQTAEARYSKKVRAAILERTQANPDLDALAEWASDQRLDID